MIFILNGCLLILHGKKDKVASYKLAEEMYAGIKGSIIIAFNGGHYIFITESKRLTEVISEFLRVITRNPLNLPDKEIN